MGAFAGYVESVGITVPTGESINATNNGGGPTVVSLTAGGGYTIATLCAHIQTRLNAVRPGAAATWQVTISRSGTSPTGKVTIAMTAGNLTLVMSANLLAILGFTVNPAAVPTATGPNQARGIWFPNRPVVADSDLRETPRSVQKAQGVSPSGKVCTAIGASMYVHTNVAWNHVAIDRLWKSDESTVNASYERFWEDIFGFGHTWFAVGAVVNITDHRSVLAGSAGALGSGGWYPQDIPDPSELRMSMGRFTGFWTVLWPRITSET